MNSGWVEWGFYGKPPPRRVSVEEEEIIASALLLLRLCSVWSDDDNCGWSSSSLFACQSVTASVKSAAEYPSRRVPTLKSQVILWAVSSLLRPPPHPVIMAGSSNPIMNAVNKLLDWIKSLFWKEEMELTLVGLQYSGKTTFVNVISVSIIHCSPLHRPSTKINRQRRWCES